MKIRILLLLLFFLYCSKGAYSKEITYTGTVVDSQTLLPLSDASVVMFNDQSVNTVTDDSGRFTISREITNSVDRKRQCPGWPEMRLENNSVVLSGFAPAVLVTVKLFSLSGHCLFNKTQQSSEIGNITFSNMLTSSGTFIIKVNDFRPKIINASSLPALRVMPLQRFSQKSQSEEVVLFIKKNGYYEKRVTVSDSGGVVDTIRLTVIPPQKSSLLQNEKLQAGEKLVAKNNSVYLYMQSDGNLVLYRSVDNHALWTSNTSGHPGAFFIVQGDGNLVIYDGGTAIWNNKPKSGQGFSLTTQNDGNLNLTNTTGSVWSTNTRAPSCNLKSTITGPPARSRIITNAVYPTKEVIVADYVVTDFGADNTGLADATDAFQSAIDACYKNGGGTIWVPAGVYTITSTLYVKPFVSLQGDWCDPDSSTGEYGTVIRAAMPEGESGYSLFMVGGSAGVKGVTIYYPNQDIASPVKYNYTFYIPGNEAATINYMMSSIINCTMLNAYKGIGVTILGGVHECTTVRNVKGTVLYRGVVAYNGADVGIWQDITFQNSYWASERGS
ncbi:MAG: hypothetical protein HQK83_02315, partial [Fibrobacteria bacterium]|nr:hypothetical protein [Fibrobacteria bacterium]